MHPHVDKALAAKLERIGARELESFYLTGVELGAAPDSRIMHVCGGVATYMGPGSPLNHAVGIGFDGPFTPGTAEEIEDFFTSRAERAVVTLSPLADPSVADVLGMRGWTLAGFENVLIRELPVISEEADELHAEPTESGAGDIEVVEALTEEDRDLWAQVAAVGFSAPLDPLPAQLTVAAVASRRKGSRLFLGYVDGAVAGTGELGVDGGVGWLSADTTLPAYRGRGVQRAIQEFRLAEAARAGCGLAVSEALPGSVSQRNMERLGFRLAYTRVELVAPATGHDETASEG